MRDRFEYKATFEGTTCTNVSGTLSWAKLLLLCVQQNGSGSSTRSKNFVVLPAPAIAIYLLLEIFHTGTSEGIILIMCHIE